MGPIVPRVLSLLPLVFSLFAASSRAQTPSVRKPVVAVLELKGSEIPPRSLQLWTDLLRTRVIQVAGRQVEVMTAGNQEYLLKANGIDPATVCDGATCDVDLLKNLDADYGFSGSVTRLSSGSYLGTLQLYDTAKGSALGAAEIRARDEEGVIEALKQQGALLCRKIPGLADVRVGEAPSSSTPVGPVATVRLGGRPTRVEAKTGLVWVDLPGGSFHFGCEPQDRQCDEEEMPGRRASVKAFSLMQTEVTNGAYERCKLAGVCEDGSSGESNHPVTNVSWHDATKFCRWVGGRLPTAEEWEYAAKSGNSRIYPWGDSPPDATRTNCSSCGDRYSRTSPVGSFPAGDTPWGLEDMAGNLWEWTSTDYDDFAKELRGGSWFEQLLRASFRNRDDPDNRNYTYGFRCAQ